MKVSQLKPYTVGTVAANKPLDSKVIEFTPDEENVFMDGEITDNSKQDIAKGKNAQGQSYEKSLTTTASMKATWLPISNPNRKSAPDVRRGERVIIYQFADADKYYWATLFDDIKLRKLETVIYAISNVRDENKEETADSTYFFEWSTHKKLVHLHTSKNDGEPFAYDIQINAKDGFIQITDDVGNFIELDSTNTKITAYNIDNSYITLDKEDITGHCKHDLKLIAGNDILIQAGRHIQIQSGQSIEEKTGNIRTISEKTTNEVPQTINTGNQETIGITKTGGLSSVPGPASSSGGISSVGDVDTQGNFNTDGNITATGNITGNRGIFPGGVTAPNV
jgi:hypothetical protein